MSRQRPYTDYDICPRILDFFAAGERDVLEKCSDLQLAFIPSRKHGLSFSEIRLSRESVFDLMPATYEGLLDDLIPGSEFAERFQNEWGEFDITADPLENLSFGVWAYYPRPCHLVRFSDPFWHRLALVIRNSMLLRDPEMRLAWHELRARMEVAVVACAGCSVGGAILHAIARDIRPLHVKAADCKTFHLTNANRVTLGYDDFCRNKAIVIAEQLHRIDPFLAVSAYAEGVHEENLRDFLAGNPDRKEPSASVLVEEIDDIEMKIRFREAARELGIPVVMATDIGSAVQLDVRRFDRSRNLPLIFGITDEELYAVLDRFLNEKTREAWYEFFIAVVGRGALIAEEFRRIILKEDQPLFGGAPQLGSTTMAAGGIAAEAIARLVLGYTLPERMFLHKYTGEVRIEGVRL